MDVSKAFANYNVMVTVVRNFTTACNRFFFAESWLFLAAFSHIVASWFEVTLAIATFNTRPAISTVDKVIVISRATGAVSMAAYLSVSLVVLFWQAAAVTQACTGVTARAHNMVGVLEHLSDEKTVQKGVNFLKHVERGEQRFGFRSMGITISKSLILKSVYLVGLSLAQGY